MQGTGKSYLENFDCRSKRLHKLYACRRLLVDSVIKRKETAAPDFRPSILCHFQTRTLFGQVEDFSAIFEEETSAQP
jgi:hypothetical protein